MKINFKSASFGGTPYPAFPSEYPVGGSTIAFNDCKVMVAHRRQNETPTTFAKLSVHFGVWVSIPSREWNEEKLGAF